MPVEDEKPPDPLIAIVLAGAFGGMLSPLLRVALAFTQQDRSDLNFNLLYWCGAALLALLGAGTAWGFGETRRQKAILLGLSLPAFLQVAVTDAQRSATHPKAHAGPNFSLVSSAYAAEPSAPSERTMTDVADATLARTLTVRSLNSETDVALTFVDAAGNAKLVVTLPAKGTLQLPVPDEAAAVQFAVGENASKTVQLPVEPRSSTTLDIRTNIRLRYGLGSAFGQKPTTEVDFEISPAVPSRSPSADAVARQGYLFYGIRQGDGWYERHFARLGSSPDAFPQASISVRALDAVNIRSAVIKYVDGQWKNAPTTGVLTKDSVVRVLDVIHVPSNPDFIWIRFESQ